MRLIAGLFIALGLIGCEEQYEKTTAFIPPQTVKSSADVTAEQVLSPTNPTAGDALGKEPLLDPAESQRRQAINSVQPIVWGQSMAGISIATTYEEALGILSNPISRSSGFYIYSEYLAVFWSGGDPNVPLAMVALDGYSGSLELPAPYQSISTGTDISSNLASTTTSNDFVKALSSHFHNEPAVDCLAARTCRVLAFDDGSKFLDFKTGRIIVDTDGTVSDIYSLFPQTFPTRITGAVDFENSTANGFGFATTRIGLENQISGALDVVRSPLSLYRDPSMDDDMEAFVFYYDDLNLGVQWKEEETPESILVRKDFLGSIIVKNVPLSTTNINSSMLSFIDAGVRPDPATVNDADLINIHAPRLMRDLDTLIYNRAVDYDCQVEETCKINVFIDRIELNLDTGTFVVDRTPNMNLQMVSINESRYE